MTQEPIPLQQATEQIALQPEHDYRRLHFVQTAGRVTVAALAPFASFISVAKSVPEVAPVMPVAVATAADVLGGFDASVVDAYREIDNHVDTGSKDLDTGLATAGSSALGIAESLAIGMAITRNKKAKELFRTSDAYREDIDSRRGPVRKFIMKNLERPFNWLSNKSDSLENSKKLSEDPSKVLKGLGRAAIDSLKALGLTSSGAIWEETAKNNPPSDRRKAWLVFLGVGALQGAIKGFRELGQNVHTPIVQVPMGKIAEGFDYATNLNLTHPWETPVSLSAFGVAALGLFYTAAKRAEFNKEHPDEEEPKLISELATDTQTVAAN